MKNLRNALTCYRETQGLTVRQFAGTLGIPATTLSRFERMSKGVQGETLSKIVVWLLDPRATRGTGSR